MRILIAEDEPVSRRRLETTLVNWGHNVVVCSDGSEAWQALQCEDAPPLAILDWMMPGMDGPEICRRARESSNLGETYIILLTARRDREDIVQGLEAGANDYVIKPFDLQELRARWRGGTDGGVAVRFGRSRERIGGGLPGQRPDSVYGVSRAQDSTDQYCGLHR